MNYFFETLKTRNEAMFYFGLLCLAGALACLLFARVQPTQVLGINAWYKPFKFLMSSAIFVWTMTWYLGYLDKSPALDVYAWGMIVLFTFENGYIIWQASRGELSHFNVRTPTYSMLYSLMAFAAVGIAVWSMCIGSRFFIGSFPDLPTAYLWGIRMGFLLFFVFSLQGLSMGGRLSHNVGAPEGMFTIGIPLLNWSIKYGDLRVAHFLGMHALQILPLLSWYVLRSVPATVIAGILYGCLTLLSYLEALAGKPFWLLSLFGGSR